MPLRRLRFTIRTIMTGVLAVALLCWVSTTVAGRILFAGGIALGTFLIVLGFVLVIPALGATWAARRTGVGKIDPVTGGILGGSAQATLLMVAAYFLSDEGNVSAQLFETALFLFPANVALGVIAGVFVTFRVVLSTDSTQVPSCVNPTAPLDSEGITLLDVEIRETPLVID